MCPVQAESYDEFQLLVRDSIKTNAVYSQVIAADMRKEKDNIGYLRLEPSISRRPGANAAAILTTIKERIGGEKESYLLLDIERLR